MNHAPRKFHRLIAPWLALPLVVTLATGITYRVGRAWFGLGKENSSRTLAIHAGGWLGDTGSMAYVILMGLGLLLLLATGTYLVLKSRAKGQPRVLHRMLGAVLLLPLTASALTGIAFKLGEDWFHWSDDTLDLLMSIHDGSWLGPVIRPFYVLAIGVGLLVMTGTGLKLAGFLKKKPAKKA